MPCRSLILILFIGMWMVSYTSSRISASVCSTPVISILCNELQQPITLVSSSISPPDICSWPLVSNIKLCKDKQSAESKELPYKRFHEVEMGVLEVVQSKGVGKAISENMSRSASTIAELKAKVSKAPNIPGCYSTDTLDYSFEHRTFSRRICLLRSWPMSSRIQRMLRIVSMIGTGNWRRL